MSARALFFLLMSGLAGAPAQALLVVNQSPGGALAYDEATGDFVDVLNPSNARLIEAPDGDFLQFDGLRRVDGLSGLLYSPIQFFLAGSPEAEDVLFTPAGETLVLRDPSENKVSLFDANGDFAFDAITDEGVSKPWGAAFGPDGDLFVVDNTAAAYPIYRYDTASGALVELFATGPGPARPRDLAFGPDGHLYVSDNSDTIFRFDGTTGALLGAFASGGGLFEPRSLTFGPDGHLYVASYFTEEVLRYDGTTGAFIDAFVSGGSLGRPSSIDFGPGGDLFVASDFSHAEVRRYDGATGADLGVFADGSTLGTAHTGLSFGPGGHLYATVSDSAQTLGVVYDGATGAILNSYPVADAFHLLAQASDPRIYVSSPATASIQRYEAATGVPTDVLGSGELEFPSSMTYGPGGDLYIANTGTNDVRRYDPTTFDFQGVFASGGGLQQPVDLAFGPDGHLYVVGRASDNVVVYDGTTGAVRDVLSDPSIVDPLFFEFGDDGLLYLVDVGNINPSPGKVVRFDIATGDLVDVFVQLPQGGRAFSLLFTDLPGPIPGVEELTDHFRTPALSWPEAVATGPDGSVYVADPGAVVKIAPDGTVTQILDETGGGTGFPMTGAHDVAVAPDGNVYVAAIWSDNVFRIDPAGGVTQVLDGSGAGPGAPLQAPWYLAVDDDNNVYVTGNVSRNVIKLEPDGTKTELIDGNGDNSGEFNGDLFGPRGVSVDTQGNVYVAGWGRHNLFKITPAGAITRLADFGSGLNRPEDCQVDTQGNVFVVNTEGASVMRVDAETGETFELASAESTGGLMGEPRRLGLGRFGNVIVTSSVSNNVLSLQGNGDVVELIDPRGAGFGGVLTDPVDVAIDAQQRVIAIGRSSRNVLRFTPNNKRCGMGPEVVPLLAGILAWRRRARSR